ncbi:MAG TPA: cytochrome c oxidase assembly protein [Spongiibacteraceae bacterium]|nr:cytochrome c oxidase assembly protein [Spongiibacteraceae bacterium]HCS28382.1 cytochrome c oxidase assembly protein [Spongiibacteraceae bacterium]|tara:strand:+ start:288 stop:854 length:567 start_codon:yes stop_codon:yes gene_type:complete
MAESTDKGILYTTAKLLAVCVAMFAFVFVVMVPLYNVLCEALGINGKTGGRYEVAESVIDTSRTVKIQFVANFNEQMPWEFRPNINVVEVHPGEPTNITYYAHNTQGRDMVAQAIPSVVPSRAAEYFHKTECFCFNRQPLIAGGEADLGLQFIVDPDLPRDIQTITLSYTIFDVTEMAPPQSDSVAAR